MTLSVQPPVAAGGSRLSGGLRHTARWLVAALLLVLAAAQLSCAGKGGGDGLLAPTVNNSGLHIQGVTVSWQTDLAARGWVRYGFTAAANDHAAYPAAAGRADRAFTTSHSVTLLDVRAGQLVYVRAVAEPISGDVAMSSLDTFTATVDSPGPILTATMIHIGFGDSHLVTFPTTGKHLLIDAGERSAGRAVAQFLTQHGVASIDGMLATHVHEDHLGGMVGNADSTGVLTSYPPQVVFDSPSKVYQKPAYTREIDLLNAHPSVRHVTLHRFDTSSTVPDLAFDPAVAIQVLNSGLADDVPHSGYEGTVINNESIVLRFTYGDVSFVIGGDAETETCASILNVYPQAQLEVEYYKSQHHGLYDGNSAAWINALRPRIAFIPNTAQVWNGDLASALATATGRLNNIGAHIYAIDDLPTLGQPRGSGAQHNITFATDGTSYEVRVELATQSTATSTENHACDDTQS